MTTTATKSEFANLIGKSPSYVTALKDAGRLVLTEDGKRVEVEASKKRIEETAGAHGEGSREYQAQQRVQTREPPTEQGDESDDKHGQDNLSRAYWDRREAAAKARIKELELAELEGKLVDIETVRRAGTDVGTLLRSNVENLVDQLAPVLAPITDEDRMRAVLADHFETVLTEMSKKLSALGEETQTEVAG